jgi:parvulin-like peptidyl-prolyl isomerase
LAFAGAGAGGTACAQTQTLDSVVASIGNTAITASDVEREYRFERFLAGQWPPAPANADALHAARQRLAYQMLLTTEENAGPGERLASQNAAAQTLAALRKEYAHADDFQQALHDLGMTEAEVRARIAQEDLMLRLIDERLRPAALPTDDEVAAYYRSAFVPEFQKKNGSAAAPPLAAVASQIREVLVQQHINELLDQWINELQPTAHLRFHPFPG